jgi:flagellar hook-basal body complex protein FliE
MDISTFANAASAYIKAPRAGGGLLGKGAEAGGGDFLDMVKDAAKGALQDARRGEQMSMKAVAGKAELADVVAAVGNAEITLQTVVAMRDRMIQAYQEVLRMPI